MEKVTLEQTHALLEKLAEYVMTQVPTRAEMDKQSDEIHQQLDLIRTEQAVFSKTFELHHKRISLLEGQALGYRVHDKEGDQ